MVYKVLSGKYLKVSNLPTKQSFTKPLNNPIKVFSLFILFLFFKFLNNENQKIHQCITQTPASLFKLIKSLLYKDA